MKRSKALAIGATAAAVGVAGSRRHPRLTASRPSAAPGLTQCPTALFDLPADVTHRTVPTPDGGELHLIERGEGRPLVLLHGITLRADVWAPQFHQLADRYRVIAVDLRGHGTSTAGTDGYGLPRLATDLATVLETLDLRDAVFVGHSMGGMTIMQFCGDHPDVLDERVAGVVFVATRAHAVVPALRRRRGPRLGDRGAGAGSTPVATIPPVRDGRRDGSPGVAFGQDPSAERRRPGRRDDRRRSRPRRSFRPGSACSTTTPARRCAAPARRAWWWSAPATCSRRSARRATSPACSRDRSCTCCPVPATSSCRSGPTSWPS